MTHKLQCATSDIRSGFSHWRIWLMLSWQDIQLRYRRSQLGPFWITLSMAVTIYMMGLLYGHIFKMDLQHYFPYLASGMLTWALISALLVENTNTFIESESYLKQIRLPYTVFVLRTVARNFIIFLHNFVILIPLYFIFSLPINWQTLYIIPGIAIILLNGFIYGYILAMLGARYRDFSQIVSSVVQILFFMTPIMWNIQQLPPQYQYIVYLNPVYHFLNLVRAPILGAAPTTNSLMYVAFITLVGLIIFMLCFTKVRHRIIYWL